MTDAQKLIAKVDKLTALTYSTSLQIKEVKDVIVGNPEFKQSGLIDDFRQHVLEDKKTSEDIEQIKIVLVRRESEKKGKESFWTSGKGILTTSVSVSALIVFVIEYIIK